MKPPEQLPTQIAISIAIATLESIAKVSGRIMVIAIAPDRPGIAPRIRPMNPPITIIIRQ